MCTDNISETECTIFLRHRLHLICAFTPFCMGKERNKIHFFFTCHALSASLWAKGAAVDSALRMFYVLPLSVYLSVRLTVRRKTRQKAQLTLTNAGQRSLKVIESGTIR